MHVNRPKILMRTRLWYELAQAKYNDRYICLLIGRQRQILNGFNMVVAVFSTAGIMGWKFWDNLPVVACGIIAAISLIKLVQPHLIPSDKQIEKLDKVADFYFDFYLKLEALWFDHENELITNKIMQDKFQELKQSEREINKIINEIHKKPNKHISIKAQNECDIFFQKAFNTTL